MTRPKPQLTLPKPWRWIWNNETEAWQAGKGPVGSTSNKVWCHQGVFWDTCNAPIPVEIVLLVLKANGVL